MFARGIFVPPDSVHFGKNFGRFFALACKRPECRAYVFRRAAGGAYVEAHPAVAAEQDRYAFVPRKRFERYVFYRRYSRFQIETERISRQNQVKSIKKAPN